MMTNTVTRGAQPREAEIVRANPKLACAADLEVGRRITFFRKRAGISQTTLGIAIGVTFQQVQKYEKGMNRVGAGRLGNIAAAIGCTIMDLHGEDAGGTAMPDISSRALTMALAFDNLPDDRSREAVAAVLRALSK